jgi:ABC-type transporter Mla MlaB component
MVMSLKTGTTALPVSESAGVCYLSGDWNVQALSLQREVDRRRASLKAVGSSVKWDVSGIDRLDSVGAQVLWQHWGQKIPAGTQLSSGQQALFKILADHPVAAPPVPPRSGWFDWIRSLGQWLLTSIDHGRMLLVLLGSLLFNFVAFLVRPVRGPWREISAQVYRTGAQALGITALVGFLIGIVLSYLSAQQLAVFGAGQFIVAHQDRRAAGWFRAALGLGGDRNPRQEHEPPLQHATVGQFDLVGPCGRQSRRPIRTPCRRHDEQARKTEQYRGPLPIHAKPFERDDILSEQRSLPLAGRWAQ